LNSPEGIKRTEDVDLVAISRAPKKHTWIYVIVTLLPNLHDDPRWDAFLRTMGLADDQLK
jgi:hypothetical protein